MPDREESLAESLLVQNLRAKINDCMKGQRELLQISAVVAGLVPALGIKVLSAYPITLFLGSILFSCMALAILRLDGEIAITADYLRQTNALDEHSLAQQRWERFKIDQMQGRGIRPYLDSVSQTVGIYGLPVVASIFLQIAGFFTGMNPAAFGLTAINVAMWILFVEGSIDAMRRYGSLGKSPGSGPDNVETSS